MKNNHKEKFNEVIDKVRYVLPTVAAVIAIVSPIVLFSFGVYISTNKQKQAEQQKQEQAAQQEMEYNQKYARTSDTIRIVDKNSRCTGRYGPHNRLHKYKTDLTCVHSNGDTTMKTVSAMGGVIQVGDEFEIITWTDTNTNDTVLSKVKELAQNQR